MLLGKTRKLSVEPELAIFNSGERDCLRLCGPSLAAQTGVPFLETGWERAPEAWLLGHLEEGEGVSRVGFAGMEPPVL